MVKKYNKKRTFIVIKGNICYYKTVPMGFETTRREEI